MGSLALRHRTQIDPLDPVRSERSACFDAPHTLEESLSRENTIRAIWKVTHNKTNYCRRQGEDLYSTCFGPILDLFGKFGIFTNFYRKKTFGISLKCDENKNRDQNRSISPRNTYSRLQEDGQQSEAVRASRVAL